MATWSCSSVSSETCQARTQRIMPLQPEVCLLWLLKEVPGSNGSHAWFRRTVPHSNIWDSITRARFLLSGTLVVSLDSASSCSAPSTLHSLCLLPESSSAAQIKLCLISHNPPRSVHWHPLPPPSWFSLFCFHFRTERS